jgi:hypothetical protein
MNYTEIQGFKWAIGARLETNATWPDRNDCTRPILAPRTCPLVQVTIASINPAIWKAELVASAAYAVVDVQAAGNGDGGFSVRANGDTFTPYFVLTATSATEIWFERANGHRYGDVIPGPITELQLSRGQDAAVAVTLRDATGAHVCGPVPATVTLSGNVFSYEHLLGVDYVNFPYHVTAGNSAGQGAMQVAAAGLQATLRVVVNP